MFLFPAAGYIVFSGVRRSNGVQGLRVIVQSDRTPDYVESRIEGFLATMKVVCYVCQDRRLPHYDEGDLLCVSGWKASSLR